MKQETSLRAITREYGDKIGLSGAQNLCQNWERLNEAQALARIGSWESDIVTGEIYWSEELFRLYGLLPTPAPPAREDWMMAIPLEDQMRIEAATRQAIMTGHPQALEHQILLPHGEKREVDCLTQAVRDAQGRVVRLIGTVRDITGQRRAEQRVQIQYQVTRIVAEAPSLREAAPALLQTIGAGLGWQWGALWQPDDAAGVLHCMEFWHEANFDAPQFEADTRKWTFSPGVGLPGCVWAGKAPVWIEDVTNETGFLRAESARHSGLHGGAAFPILFEGAVLGIVEFLSRERRTFQADLQLLMDAVGSQIGQFIRRKEDEEALRHSQAFVQRIADASPNILYIYDLVEHRTIYSNREPTAALGYTPDDLKQMGDQVLPRIMHPDDMPRVVAHHAHFFTAQDGEITEVEYRMRHVSGAWRWMRSRDTVFSRDESGTPRQIIGAAQDITERKEAEQRLEAQNSLLNEANALLEAKQAELAEANARLERLATIDGLTGLKNHRAFQERLALERERALRTQMPMSLVLLDVDRFKQYNDTFGHPAGDMVLKQIGALLEQCARQTDLTARYGGEEFVVVLPNTDAQGAQIAAERLRVAIETFDWSQTQVTASFGIATLTSPKCDGADAAPDASHPLSAGLLTQADAAMYASKRRGRNRVTHFCELKNAVGGASAESAPLLPDADAPLRENSLPVWQLCAA